MSVIRWRLEDTEDSTSVTLPLNPNEMSTPTFGRNVQFGWTSRWTPRVSGGGGLGPGEMDNGLGRPRLVDSGEPNPVEWTWSGVINREEHYNLLLEWTKKCHVLRVTDHLGRTFEIIIQKFDPIERRRTALNEWRCTYTMTCLLLKEVTD